MEAGVQKPVFGKMIFENPIPAFNSATPEVFNVFKKI